MATIILVVIMILGVANGLRRGIIRETTALVGVLLGAVLAQGWAAEWSGRLNSGTVAAQGATTTERIITLSLLIGVAVLCGYGSGLLLPTPTTADGKSSLSLRQRIGGGVLGFVNMGLLAGFTLQFIQRLWYGTPTGVGPGEPVTASWIQQNPITNFLVLRLGLLLLGIALILAVFSLIVALFRVVRRPAASLRRADAKPLEARPGDPRPSDLRPAAAYSASAKPADALSAGSKAAGFPTPEPVVPADTKVIHVRPTPVASDAARDAADQATIDALIAGRQEAKRAKEGQ